MQFSHINPVATFAYGDIQIRIKLKPNTKFLYYGENKLDFSQYCNSLIKGRYKLQDTVIVRSFQNSHISGVDYIFCSPGPIHSWSYNTEKAYDEIVASQYWNNNRSQREGWIPYSKSNNNPIYFNSDLDNRDWSPAHLFRNLINMRAHISDKDSKIFYNPDVIANETFHFGTTRPVYWNHQTLTQKQLLEAIQPFKEIPIPLKKPTLEPLEISTSENDGEFQSEIIPDPGQGNPGQLYPEIIPTLSDGL